MNLTHLPADTAAAAERRRTLSRAWLDEMSAAKWLHKSVAELERRRRAGAILGVWIAEERRYQYPPWQFDVSGAVVGAIPSILRILRSPSGVSAGRQTSGWEEIEWFFAPHRLLNGASPAELLSRGADTVLAAAKREFSESPHARW